jgi:hypothetical protein
MSKKVVRKQKIESVELQGVNAKELLAPMEKDTWRLLVDFKKPMATDIKAIAETLGINWQATIKILIEEALMARKEREARLKGAS